MIAEEHQNRDSVEGADLGHGINVPGQSDRFDREARLERITVTPRDSPTRPVSRSRGLTPVGKTRGQGIRPGSEPGGVVSNGVDTARLAS